MGGLSRGQIALYAAVGIVLLLLGVRALRAAEPPDGAGPGADGGGINVASEPVGSGGPGPADGDVVVHVAGAVREPGVYRLAAGARVSDALKRAGGPTGGAAEDGINLAARLADGQQVVVPRRAPGGGVAAAGESEGPISLGTATAEELEEIDGIGPVTAGDIIDFRDERGGLGSIEELDEVPGIGPTTLESLTDQLQP